MLDLAFVFTIFMVMLGPIKTVPGFYMLTKDMPADEARAVAFKGAAYAMAICLGVALIMRGMAKSWHVTPDDLSIAGGILLFAAAWEMLSTKKEASHPAAPPKNAALAPLAIPIIVTPWGVAAILVFVGIAGQNWDQVISIIGLLALVMAINLIGMLFARHIIGFTGMTVFQVLGWVFAVLQAGLAVNAIVYALINLGLLHQPPMTG